MGQRAGGIFWRPFGVGIGHSDLRGWRLLASDVSASHSARAPRCALGRRPLAGFERQRALLSSFAARRIGDDGVGEANSARSPKRPLPARRAPCRRPLLPSTVLATGAVGVHGGPAHRSRCESFQHRTTRRWSQPCRRCILRRERRLRVPTPLAESGSAVPQRVPAVRCRGRAAGLGSRGLHAPRRPWRS